MRTIIGGLMALVFLGSCKEGPAPLFRELSASRTGVDFANQLRETPELNILTYLYYYNGAGVIAADFNADGLPDLYFGANQDADALYLNRGDFHFVEVTEQAGIDNSTGWTTGLTYTDINADGLPDIYICKASGYRALEGHNLLYVNLGIGEDGIPKFEEQAARYGLDFQSLATQAAFFDYDADGDLDLFLMNHSVHPNRTYGNGTQRKGYDPLSGDRLLRNDGGTFTDVSATAGIYQGKAGYGLGLGISDLDNDGFPDLYVGNDFFENDYLYMNQGDGSFREVVASEDSPLGHTTHFSMGNCLADINNDGLTDIVSLDMLPEDLVTYKTSGLEYPYPIYRQYLGNGYAPQYMQNTVQLNQGSGNFSEIGYLGGLASSEWSWGSLLADFDNDGFQDVFITNGIKGATNDMDYMNFIANEDIQRRIDQGMGQADMPLTREIPEKKVPNYIFRNQGDLSFENKTGTWLEARPTFSQGCAYADLDGDGDLDLVVNNMGEAASVYENTQQGGQSLQIRLEGGAANRLGIGAKVWVYSGGTGQLRENFPGRGYLSAVPPSLHFGLGTSAKADSLKVVWPDGRVQERTALPAVGKLELRYSDAVIPGADAAPGAPVSWQQAGSVPDFRHRENPSLDFDREPLIAFAYSNQGPTVGVADFNRDGLDDLFFAGAKRQASAVYLQTGEGGWAAMDPDPFADAALNEDTGHLVFDANNDEWPDLLVVSGGNEFKEGEAIEPRLYLNESGTLRRVTGAFGGIYLNAGGIAATDFEGDGDTDVLLYADTQAGAFGESPRHYLLRNDGTGRFEDVTATMAPALLGFGAISGADWSDLDGDGNAELIVAGHWNPITVFSQTGTTWTPVSGNGLSGTEGWWNCLKVADIDGDGDKDLLAGNWGLNSKFRASAAEPIRLYRNDFDANGSVEPLVTYYHNGVETPFASRDELGKQMPFLNKKYRTYKDFASASLKDLFGEEALEASVTKSVYELETGLYLNDGQGRFTLRRLPRMAQASAVFDLGLDDFNADGKTDIMLLGNLHEISTQLGRLDALQGQVLLQEADGGFRWDPTRSPRIPGAARSIDTLRIKGKKTYVIGRNDAKPAFLTYEINGDETP